MTASPRLLLVAVLAPPGAWAVQLVAGYAVEEAACSSAEGRAPVLGVDGGPVLAGVSGAAALVAVAAGLVGASAWSRLGRAGTAPGDGESGDGRRLLAAWAVLAAGLFLAAIAMSGLALVPVEPCSRA